MRTARNLDASLDAAAPSAFAERASDRRDAYLDNAKYALMMIVVWNHALQDFLRALDAHERRGWCERDAVNASAHGHVRAFYLLLNATGMPLFAVRERVPVEELAPRGEGGRGERGEFVDARARGVRDAAGDVRGVAGVLRGD